MKLITTALAWVKKNKASMLILLIACVFALFNFLQFKNSQVLRKKLEVANHNIKALNDTIRITKDREGNDEYNKYALLVSEVSELKNLSADLYAEVKKLKGQPATIIKGDVQIVEKPVPFVVKGEVIDNEVVAHFNYDTIYSPGNYRKLSGYTRYDLKTGLTTGNKDTDVVGMRIVTGIKNLDKGKPEIFFKSDYPGFELTAVEGAVLDPKLFEKKKTRLITTGVTVGWTPMAYDILTKKIDFKPTRFAATVGVNINILKLFRR